MVLVGTAFVYDIIIIFLLAREGCGRHCATLVEKGSAAFQSHTEGNGH